jgi:hypothetical protein
VTLRSLAGPILLAALAAPRPARPEWDREAREAFGRRCLEAARAMGIGGESIRRSCDCAAGIVEASYPSAAEFQARSKGRVNPIVPTVVSSCSYAAGAVREPAPAPAEREARIRQLGRKRGQAGPNGWSPEALHRRLTACEAKATARRLSEAGARASCACLYRRLSQDYQPAAADRALSRERQGQGASVERWNTATLIAACDHFAAGM